MVKIERTDSPEARAAVESLGKEKVRPSGTYRTEEVNKALGLMFAHKCYLCEQKGLSDLQIEHLIPHRQNRDLMFDWNNLFLSCAHCNNIKNDKYTPILDCTRTDVDKKIAFHRYRELFEEDRLDIVALDDSLETKNTADLMKCTMVQHRRKKQRLKLFEKDYQKSLTNFKTVLKAIILQMVRIKKTVNCPL